MQEFNFVDIFSNYYEKLSPEEKAKMVAEGKKKEQAKKQFRTNVLKKYGSEEAALAPCPKEQLLIEACKDLMKKDEYGYFKELDVSRSSFDAHNPTEPFKEAVIKAFPLPENLKDVWAEKNYWYNRCEERMLFDDYYGEFLPPHIGAREFVLQELLDTLPAHDVDDILARLDCFEELCSRGYYLQEEEEMRFINLIRADIIRICKGAK